MSEDKRMEGWCLTSLLLAALIAIVSLILVYSIYGPEFSPVFWRWLGFLVVSYVAVMFAIGLIVPKRRGRKEEEE